MERKLLKKVRDMSEFVPVRFGMIGCGTASIPVAEAITSSSLAELVGVYDVNAELANDLGQRFQAPIASSLAELLASTVEAVYIAVPHYLLASLTRQVLEAGKHALTEKPLAISIPDVDQLIGVAAQRNLALGVFYEMRYTSAHATAHQLTEDGAIGTIIGIQIQTLIDKPLAYWQSGYAGRSVNPWRGIQNQAGGGVVLMNTSHLLDAITYITDLHITNVSAEIGTLVADVEVEDIAAATFRFDNGAIGSLLAGAHIHGADHEERCCIYGTEGQLRLPDPYGSDPLQLYVKRDWGKFAAGQWYSIPGEPVQVYQRAIEDFAHSIRTDQCVPIDGRQARYVLSVVLAIYQSAKEKRPISIL